MDYASKMQEYLASKGVEVQGNEGWSRNFKCILHSDKEPSANMNMTTGIYKCFVCHQDGEGLSLKGLYEACGDEWIYEKNGKHAVSVDDLQWKKKEENGLPPLEAYGEMEVDKKHLSTERYTWAHSVSGDEFVQKIVRKSDGSKDVTFENGLRGTRMYDLVYARTLEKKNGLLVVVEGAKCAEKVYELGLDAFALINSTVHVSEDVLKRVFEGTNYEAVVLWGDYDDAGEKAINRVYKLIKGFTRLEMREVQNAKLWATHEGQDIADVDADKRLEIIEEAETLIDITEEEKQDTRWFVPGDEFWEMEEFDDDLVYLIDECIVKNGMTIIGGKSETCKSFLALDMMIASAMSQKWMGVGSEPGLRWLYIDQEMTCGMMKNHFKQLALGRGFDEKTMLPLLKQLHFTNYGTIPTLRLCDTDKTEELIQQLSGFDVIIFDSWAKFLAESDENSSSDTSKALAVLQAVRQATGCAMIIIAHENKTPHTYGTDKMRGSTALVADPDIILQCFRAKGGQLRVRHTKHRTLPDSDKWDKQFAITRNDTGLIITHKDYEDKPKTVDEKTDELQEKILDFLADTDVDLVPTNTIKKFVTGRGADIGNALKALVDKGNITSTVRGQATLYALAR